MANTTRQVLLPVIAFAALACRDASGPSNSLGSSRLILAVSAGSSAAGSIAAAQTFALGGDVLVLSQVDLIIRQIELDRVGTVATCATTGGDGSAATGQESGGERHGDNGDVTHDCEEVELGPVIVTLPLDGRTTQQIDVALAPGTYDRVQFQVHKPGDDTVGDSTFLAAHPDLRGVSIRARGTFNGAPFEYVSDLSAEQRLTLSPPLVLAKDSTASVKLTVDVHGWFVDATQNHLISPATALKGQPNEGLVKQNIKQSLRAKGYYGRDD